MRGTGMTVTGPRRVGAVNLLANRSDTQNRL